MLIATARTTALLLVILLMGCQGTEPPIIDQPGLIEITAVGLEFEGPTEIPSGWTTIRLMNASEMTHFALFARYPSGRGVEDHQELVAPVFQEGMDLLNEGQPDAAMEAFGNIPEWFGEIVFFGGPGFVSPGRTTEVTANLPPGTYVVECYVKTGGIFHSYNPSAGEYGMVHEITVTDEMNGHAEPAADFEMTLSRDDGIEIVDDIVPGRHTVAVRFEDQGPHENFVGHDVQLVRLNDDQDLEDLGTWMDWTQPTGLETPASFEFVGGTNEMPGGETVYLTIDVEPGRYAWVAEVPNAADKGMLKTFSVSP